MTILRVPVPGLDFKDATLFSQLKDLMRTQFDVMIESEDLREQISALASDATEDISTEMNRDLRLSFGEIVSLGVFDESPESIGYVTLNGVAVEVDGERTEVVQVMAGQFVLVRAKVLNFFVYSILRSKDDIDWAKKTSASWVRATLDLNRPE